MELQDTEGAKCLPNLAYVHTVHNGIDKQINTRVSSSINFASIMQKKKIFLPSEVKWK